MPGRRADHVDLVDAAPDGERRPVAAGRLAGSAPAEAAGSSADAEQDGDDQCRQPRCAAFGPLPPVPDGAFWQRTVINILRVRGSGRA